MVKSVMKGRLDFWGSASDLYIQAGNVYVETRGGS